MWSRVAGLAVVLFVMACGEVSDEAEVQIAETTDDEQVNEISNQTKPSSFTLPATETVLHENIPYLRIDWELLATAEFNEVYFEDENAKFWIPEFSEDLKLMDGQNIAITGYLLPLEPEENFYVLSAKPNSACFFCGNAGPETVMKLKVRKTSADLYMDNLLTFCGQFSLNRENLYEMNFILDDAQIIKE